MTLRMSVYASSKVAAFPCVALAFAIGLIVLGGAERKPFQTNKSSSRAKLELRCMKTVLQNVDDTLELSVVMKNVSPEAFYVGNHFNPFRPLNFFDYSLEIRAAGTKQFEPVAISQVDLAYLFRRPPPSESELLSNNDLVLLVPNQLVGRSFRGRWKDLMGKRGPGEYSLRVVYLPVALRQTDSWTHPILQDPTFSNTINVKLLQNKDSKTPR